MLYWLAVAAYAAAAIATRAAPGRWRWPALGGAAAAGVFLLLPVSCIALPIYRCDPSGSCSVGPGWCTTLAGLQAPYADATGMPGAFAVGAGIVLAGIAIGLMSGRRYVARPLPDDTPAARP